MSVAEHTFRPRSSKLTLGAAGVVVLVLLFYLVTRDTLVVSGFVVHLIPVTATVYFRTLVALLLGWVAISAGGLAPSLSSLGRWGWWVLGSLGALFVVEGIVGIASGGQTRALIIGLINVSIVLFALVLAYLFAARRMDAEAALRFLIRPYCYIAVFVAVAGLMAWLLVHLAIVDPGDWRDPPGMIKKIPLPGRERVYAMPYYTSFVLMDSGAEFLGLEFSRATGLFREPNQAALFVTPALFLLPLVLRGRSNRRTLIPVSMLIVAFLIVTHSVMNLAILGPIAAFVFGKMALTGHTARGRQTALVTFLILLGTAWLVWNTPTSSIRFKAGLGASYVRSAQTTLQEAPILGVGNFVESFEVERGLAERQLGVLPWAVLSLHMGILIFLGLRMMLSRSPQWYIGGAMIYIAINLIKGPSAIGTSGMYIYMLFIISLLLASYWKAAPHDGHRRASDMGIFRGRAETHEHSN